MDTGEGVGSCLVSDVSCQAACVCTDGFSGSMCSMTAQQLVAAQLIRTELINGLATLTQVQPANPVNVQSWSNTLALITSNPDEINIDTITTSQQVTISILNAASSAGSGVIPTSALGGLLSAMDSSALAMVSSLTGGSARRLSGQNINNASSLTHNAFIDTLVSILTTYGQLAARELVPGEPSSNEVYRTFRISSAAHDPSQGNVTISTPLTSMEKYMGKPASSVSVPGHTGTGSSGSLSVSAVSVAAFVYGNTSSTGFESNPLQLHVMHNGPRSLDVIQVVLQNNVEKKFDRIPAQEIFTTSCTQNDFSNTTHTCSSSGFIIHHRCRGILEILSSACPDSVQASTCASVGGTAGGCKVLSFTATNTTCVCTLSKSSRMRQLASDSSAGSATENSLSQSGAIELVSMSAFVGEMFAGTFSVASSMDSAQALQKVLTVVVMFAVLWIGGLLAIFGCMWGRELKLKTYERARRALDLKREKLSLSQSPRAVRKYLHNYVMETFPSAFSDKPRWYRLWDELTKHHRYCIIFTGRGEASDKQRIIMGVQLLTTQTMLAFLLAVFYDLQAPGRYIVVTSVMAFILP